MATWCILLTNEFAHLLLPPVCELVRGLNNPEESSALKHVGKLKRILPVPTFDPLLLANADKQYNLRINLCILACFKTGVSGDFLLAMCF